MVKLLFELMCFNSATEISETAFKDKFMYLMYNNSIFSSSVFNLFTELTNALTFPMFSQEIEIS